MNKVTKLVRVVVCGFATLTMSNCFLRQALAQRTTAAVTGLITDASESAVPGASVVVRNLATSVERSVESNALGFYVVTALQASQYSVTVSKAGFQTLTVPQLVLEVDQNATINISLKVGAISESVSVNAESVAVDTRTEYRDQPAANHRAAAERAKRSAVDAVDTRDDAGFRHLQQERDAAGERLAADLSQRRPR